MVFEDWLKLLTNHWRGMLAVLLGTLGLCALYTENQQPLYSAQSVGVFVVPGAGSIGEEYSAQILAESKANTYASLFKSTSVLEAAIDEVGLSSTPTELAARVTYNLPRNTNRIEVTVLSETPQKARDVANSLVNAAAAKIKKFETAKVKTPQNGETVQPINSITQLKLIDDATLSTTQSYPNRIKNYGAGFVIGLGLAGLWGLLRRSLETRINDAAEVEKITGISTLAVIPEVKELARGKRQLTAETGMGVEAVRKLRTNLRYVRVDRPPKAIVVTSSMPGEGKTTLAINLAQSIANAGAKTVLIDADLRRPRIHESLELDNAVGLTQILSGDVDFDSAKQKIPDSNLQIITSGKIPPNPGDMLGSNKMETFIKNLAKYNFVIIDSPPVVPVSDAVVLSKISDGVILVCRSGVSKEQFIKQSIASLQSVGGSILGTVLNGVKRTRRGQYGYDNNYGYYGSYADSTDQESRPKRRFSKKS